MTDLAADARRPDRHVTCRFELDTPRTGQVVRGDVVVVSGWALLDGKAPASVEVSMQGSGTTRARIRLPRSDVAAELPRCPESWLSGFEARVPVGVRPGEQRNLSFRVRLRSHESGEWTSPLQHVALENPAASDDETTLAASLAQQTDSLLRSVHGPTPDPTHVLIFTHSLSLGGGQLWLHQLLDGLVREHGWRATMVTQEDGALREACDELGVPVHLTSHYRVGEVSGYEGHVAELAYLAQASGAGVALVNTLGAFPATDAAQRAGIPTAWVIHESFGLSDFAYQNWGAAGLPVTVRGRWERALANANRLLFVADATRELFEPLSAPQRCQTVRYGTPLASNRGTSTAEQRAAARRWLGVSEETTLILNVGVLEPRKGQGQLVAAMNRIGARHPEALLHIVGNHPSPYGRGLARYTEESGSAENVRLLPLQRDPTPWFHAADLFVNSSDVESLPRSILEAVCCGLPVLATDVFGAREVVTDGQSGWLVEPNDVDALTVGLLRALETPPETRLEMAEQAFASIHEWLDPRYYAAEYAEVLEELARGRNVR